MYQVVCVDDEAFVLEHLQKAIDWFGFNMEIVFSTIHPLEAVHYIKKHPVHLLLTDISMPEMSGIELIHLVKEINPSISILVLSAYDNFGYVRSAMQGGAENYLLKPLDPNELSESLSIIVKHLEDRSEISKNFGPAMLTFRSNFVENWCKNTLSEEELISRASMLGVNLQLDNYTVVMFSTNPQNSREMSLLFDSLLSVFVGNYICHFYFETPSCLMCILSSPDSFNVFRFENQIEKLRPILGFPFFVSIGNIVDNYDDVCSSYHTVKKYHFLTYTSLPFMNCQNLLFSFQHQQMIERDFYDITEKDYLNEINSLLSIASPEKKICIQLAVINQGLTQLTPKPYSYYDYSTLLNSMVTSKDAVEKIMTYLSFFVHTVKSLLEESSKKSDMSHQYVQLIFAAVHDFSNKDISLKTLAAQLGMHPSYLGSFFHQQTGYYFNDYLNEERLKYAANLMKSNSARLKDVADMAGFSSQAYFNRQFKKYFNSSPNAYRREIKLKKNDL